jgi:hypothetical protein
MSWILRQFIPLLIPHLTLGPSRSMTGGCQTWSNAAVTAHDRAKIKHLPNSLMSGGALCCRGACFDISSCQKQSSVRAKAVGYARKQADMTKPDGDSPRTMEQAELTSKSKNGTAAGVWRNVRARAFRSGGGVLPRLFVGCQGSNNPKQIHTRSTTRTWPRSV